MAGPILMKHTKKDHRKEIHHCIGRKRPLLEIGSPVLAKEHSCAIHIHGSEETRFHAK